MQVNLQWHNAHTAAELAAGLHSCLAHVFGHRMELVLLVHTLSCTCPASLSSPQACPNSLSSSPCLQADYELDNDEAVALINSEAAKLAKQAKEQYLQQHPGEVKFVAGAIGPTNKTLSVSPSVENPAFRGTTYDEIEQAYYKQVQHMYQQCRHCCMVWPCT